MSNDQRNGNNSHDAGSNRSPRETQAASDASRATSAETLAFVQTLARHFTEQIRRTPGLAGCTLDTSATSLAFADYVVSLARDERHEPVLLSLASGAGAYYGEVVRNEIRGTWIGEPDDPRSLQLLLQPHFVHFSPIDQAFEAIFGATLAAADPRTPIGPPLDTSFHVASLPRADGGRADDDEGWLRERLSELRPIPEDQFYSLTGRFETLKLMLELLSAKHASEGRSPRSYDVQDYLPVLRFTDTAEV